MKVLPELLELISQGSIDPRSLPTVNRFVALLAPLHDFTNLFFHFQPEEVKRTRPYHYRAYNLAAMIVSFSPLGGITEALTTNPD